MKKILYPLSVAVAFLFTACAEDRGTSTEVAYSNDQEEVNPNHLNAYNLPGTAGLATTTITTDNAGIQLGPKQTEQSAVELVFDYYNREKAEEYYSFNTTTRMAGLAADTPAAKATGGKVTDTNDNRNPGGDPGNKSNTGATTTSTTANMDQAGTADGRDKKKQSTTKKAEQKKERLTPYNDRKN